MPKRYDHQDIQKEINEAMKCPKTLYRADFVLYTSNIKSTKDRCSEFVAQYLLNNKNEFDSKIPKIPRRNPYISDSRNGVHDWSESNQIEKKIAYKMRNRSQKEKRDFTHIGKILDYEVPLSDTQNYDAGEIDLLAWDGKNLVILELKRPDSSETLLRCVLEAFTYWKTVDHEKLAKDFGHEDAPVRAAALVFMNSQPHKDWLDDGQPHIKELMERLGVGLYVLDNDKDLNVAEV